MRPGERIGPYVVVAVLGRGGMGVVYEVRHPEVPRRLALKLIDPIGADDDALARFQREGEALARVRHPGVVAVHAAGRTERGAREIPQFPCRFVKLIGQEGWEERGKE